MTERAIGMWENGDRVPSSKYLLGLALTLGVSMDWLYGEDLA